LNNDSLAEVKFEQQELGNPDFGCDLAPIDFVELGPTLLERSSSRSYRRAGGLPQPLLG
jgi:hypothetical protein